MRSTTVPSTVILVYSTRTVLHCFGFFFLLNIYYLYVHIQLHELNKFFQYFHNYLTICTVHRPLFLFSFFHRMLVLLVLFLSFLLNIYMCIYSYIDTTHSYKCANRNVVQCFGLFNLCALFIMLFFFFAGVVCAFLSFPLNIYYLYVHMQLHRLNKFL